MKPFIILPAALILLASGCGRSSDTQQAGPDTTPKVLDNGMRIEFRDKASLDYFKTGDATVSDLRSELAAPANVTAIVIPSEEGPEPVVLFENPELAGNYAQLLQHRINMRQIRDVSVPQRRIELSRVEELKEHGAASGRELLEARTSLAIELAGLANEKAAMVEHETKLKAAGFSPEKLKQARPGTAIVVCDIPEDEAYQLEKGKKCKLTFTSFPETCFEGQVDAIADLLDVSTRMVKVRVVLDNPGSRLKAGMFASVSFGISEGRVLNIPQESLVTVQGEHYVFVKDGSAFLRRKVTIGHCSGDRVLVLSGLGSGEKVACRGAMQLKGLSFGY